MPTANNFILLRALQFSAMLFILPTASESARILGYFPTTTKSHAIIHCAVADALAQAGHDVTVIGAVANVNKKAKYKYIHMEIQGFTQDFTQDIVNKKRSSVENLIIFTQTFLNIAHDHMSQPKMKEFLRTHGENSFDLVILGWFMNDFQIGLAAHFKCPIIMSFMVQPMTFVNKFFGNPNEVAYTPSPFLEYKQPMNFWERLVTFLYNGIVIYLMGPMLDYYSEMYYNQHFPSPHYPTLSEMRKNVSLMFANHHQISQGPIHPNVPAIIEIGGVQIKEQPDRLPSDIASVLDNSTEGVIYFSLGSSVQGSVLDKQKAGIMFNVLSRLPYTVLWKWGDSQFPGVSPNIVYKSWLPQDDVLAHPKVKLFITHGGLGSVVEAQYHGVPMVGLPLFADQPGNIARAEQAGFGLKVDYATLSEEKLRSAIVEVIQNPKYKNTISSFSKLYRDRPMTARQMVVYWTEYVLRYNGAKHLQSPAVHMNVFQLYSLDVISVLLGAVVLVLLVLIKSIQFVCCRCRGKTAMNQTKKMN